MLLLCDLPSFVIDQILRSKDASYLAIKLWLCGNQRLCSKLSQGLTFLELHDHPLGASCFPKMVFKLQALAHLYISSPQSLVRLLHEWQSILRSLPNTLESLTIVGAFDPSNLDAECDLITTKYPRGASHAIELDSLFPRLHTLVIPTGTHSSNLFPALPSSLTRLDATIHMRYDQGPSHFSRLPPSLLQLNGRLSWFIPKSGEAAVAEIRRDCANAPAGLQKIPDTFPLRQASGSSNSPLFECWLPKSLLVADWETYPWSPTIARTMPPHLLELKLDDSDIAPFEDSNWIAEIPRTLTKLGIKRHTNAKRKVDFASYAHCLPPALTSLTLLGDLGFTRGAFGNWSALSGNHFWPSNLQTLKLIDFWIKPSDIVTLPRTVKKLQLSVSSATTTSEHPRRPKLHTALLPSSMTALKLEWTPEVAVELSLTKFNLLTCTLSFQGDEPIALPTSSFFAAFPASLVSLKAENIIAQSTLPPTNVASLLPSLRRLELQGADWESFEHIPRGVTCLRIQSLSGIASSPLLADGKLLQHLPTSLKTIEFGDQTIGLPDDFELPTQHFDHLTFLQHLSITAALTESSSMLRNLPRGLRSLRLKMKELTEDELQFLPKRLESCDLGYSTPTLVEHLPFKCLARLGYVGIVQKVAQTRVIHATKHQ